MPCPYTILLLRREWLLRQLLYYLLIHNGEHQTLNGILSRWPVCLQCTQQKYDCSVYSKDTETFCAVKYMYIPAYTNTQLVLIIVIINPIPNQKQFKFVLKEAVYSLCDSNLVNVISQFTVGSLAINKGLSSADIDFMLNKILNKPH